MKQYRFDHEELFVLLAPAIQIIKEAENSEDDHGESCLRSTSRSARTLVLNNQYSRACGDWSSAFNWHHERNPAVDVEMYRHAGLAVVVQLKLLGLAWKTIRSVLWQQAQPKTELYLDRFMLVARYCYDNPELLIKVATQYPEVWTCLVDHLEPRVVDSTWKTYAAIRDIGLARRTFGRGDFTTTRTPEHVPTRMSGIPDTISTMYPGPDGVETVDFCGKKFTITPETAPRPCVKVDKITGEKSKGWSFDGGDYCTYPTGTPYPDKPWSVTADIKISEKAQQAFMDGTHWLSPKRDESRYAGWVQYAHRDRISVFVQELTQAEEQALEQQYGPFVKTPYTGSIKVKPGDIAKTLVVTGNTYNTVTARKLPFDPKTTVPKTLAEYASEIVGQFGSWSFPPHATPPSTFEIGSGQPGIQWCREFRRALTPAEHAELYAALQVSHEAADVVWKRITGGK